MSDAAKVKIEKFSGAGINGLFYNEGFSPSIENGKSVLNESFVCSEKINNTTSKFTDIADVKAVAFLNTLYGSESYRLILDSLSHLYAISDVQNYIKNGKVGGVSADGNYLYNQYPDILELPSGNLVYSSAYHLSFVIRGTCASGSNTTTIVDKAGRNFTTLGIVVSDGKRNKVINPKTGVTYTITAITTTNSANDTITFTANGANTNSLNDEFLAFVYDKWDLNIGISLPSFKTQPDGMHWHRQIKDYYGDYYILNGNYLAKLDKTETTLTSNFKQFFSGHQAISFDVNVDKILFSTYSQSGAYLCLWDGSVPGFNNIIKIDSPAFDIKAYSTGWIFLINGILYFTNGYAIQKLSEYLDGGELSNLSIASNSFNQIAVLNNTIYCVSSYGNGNRNTQGVYAYNPDKGWAYIPVKYKGRNYANPTSIFINNGYDSTWGTFNHRIEIGGASFFNNLYDYGAETDPNSHSFIYFIDLPVKTQISKVELTLARSLKKLLYSFNPYKQAKISVSIGDGANGILSQAQYSAITGLNTIAVNGTYQTTQVGDEIIIKDGACQGERTFIKSIANQGLSNEEWTVEPALSATYNNTGNVKIIRVKPCETKTVDLSNIKEPIVFNSDGSFYKQIYLEVVIYGTSNSYPVSILDINLF